MDQSKFYYLYNAKVIADDGTFLGVISQDKDDTNSICNPYGNYGSKISLNSIFNPVGEYGNKFSHLSPFNELTDTPPKIIKDNLVLGYLTLNKFIKNRVDTNELINWLLNK